jgi:beta-glucosidase
LHLLSSDVQLIKKVKSYGNPVVVIIIAGRPLIIDNILHYCDAVVAAWLPDTEGDGIAEVLFGDFNPAGVLSHTWPKHMSQIPINVANINYAPLYPYGYGITSFNDSPSGSSPVLLSAVVTEEGIHVELAFNH